jgi:predicted nuclease of predicted toxin-antitoxin system
MSRSSRPSDGRVLHRRTLLGPDRARNAHAGFDIVRAVDVCPAGDDETVLAEAYARDRILLTEDYDFVELCIRLRMPTRGVIIVTVKNLPVARQGARVVHCLSGLGVTACVVHS